MEKVQANESNRDAEDLENIWTGMKDCLLQTTEEVCGKTKALLDTLQHGVVSGCGKTSRRKTT